MNRRLLSQLAGALLATACLLATTTTATAMAGAQPEALDRPPREGLHWLDWVMIAAYALGMIGVGVYYARKQRSTSEYFVGSGQMSSTLIGVSLFATLLSTISYLADPGEMIKHGPMAVFAATPFVIPIAFLIVGYIIIPIWMKHQVTSAYELLEAKLGYGARALGGLMFITLRLVWMSLLIFLSSQALVVMLGLGPEMAPWMAAATGAVAIIYTSLGGLRAVVISDAIQAMLFLGGAILTIIMVSYSLGGVDQWWPTAWYEHWDTQPIHSWDPTTRVTLVGMIITGLVWRVCTSAGDQTQVQRFMATGSAKAARRSYLVNIIVGLLVSTALGLVGLALLGHFQAHQHLIPYSGDMLEEADRLFPYYITHFLPAGVSGLVVAAMFAAAMSSVDSGVNSITAVITRDFLEKFGLQPATQKGNLRLAIILAFAIGIVVVINASTMMHHVPGNFLEVTNRTTNLLVTPLFALFVLAMFIPFANGLGAGIGAAYGFSTALWVAYWNTFTGMTPPSFMWIGISALIVNVAVGCFVSWIAPTTQPRALRTLITTIFFLVLLVFWFLILFAL